MSSPINFNNTYSLLPSQFFCLSLPSKIPAPKIIEFNADLASDELDFNIQQYTEKELADIFTGQKIIKGSSPIAMAYAGHQFGHFSPSLGDGRAILLGEILTKKSLRYDIQLKGSGVTKFSRNGDGKSSIGPVIREYMLSEFMYHLGVPTTRALCVALTGETIYREQALPGGILTRVASGHIRVGTFEYFAALGDFKSVEILLDYSINRHFPSIKNSKNRTLDFLNEVANVQSTLVAKWMSFGFIHGVMNTDNMAITGETLDYGPCAFMDNFSSDRVYSSIDRQGRYRYNNQISIAKWNLYRLAECFVSLIDNDPKKSIAILEEFLSKMDQLYQSKWLQMIRPKLGLLTEDENDEKIIQSWLQYLQDEDLDFTNSFRNLSPIHSNSQLPQTKQFQKFQSLWKKG